MEAMYKHMTTSTNNNKITAIIVKSIPIYMVNFNLFRFRAYFARFIKFIFNNISIVLFDRSISKTFQRTVFIFSNFTFPIWSNKLNTTSITDRFSRFSFSKLIITTLCAKNIFTYPQMIFKRFFTVFTNAVFSWFIKGYRTFKRAKYSFFSIYNEWFMTVFTSYIHKKIEFINVKYTRYTFKQPEVL